ncbi:hypothetical protein TJA_13950 [Thermus sp. LT1-2-5]
MLSFSPMTSAPVGFGNEGFWGVMAQDFPLATLHPLALGVGRGEVISVVIVRAGKVTAIPCASQIARLKGVSQNAATLEVEL